MLTRKHFQKEAWTEVRGHLSFAARKPWVPRHLGEAEQLHSLRKGFCGVIVAQRGVYFI